MKQLANTYPDRWKWGLLGLVSFLILSLNIGGYSIYALDEAKNAECAREMYELDEWIVPTFNYEPRFDKPPLHYYAMIVAYKLLGVSEWTARFFSAVCGALTVCLIFGFAYKYVSEKTAYGTALALLSSLHYNIQFHMAVPDPYLILWITLSLCAFFAYWKDRERPWLWVMYISMGLAFLTKGPIGIALPGMVFLVFLISTKSLDKRVWKTYRMIPGALLTMLVSLPWYLLVGWRTNGLWLKNFFLDHNVGRYTDTMEGHGGIFLLTLVFIWVGMLPFSIFIYSVLKQYSKDKSQYPFLVFCFWTVIVITAFFSISQTKLPNYTVPLYPFLAVLIGQFLAISVENKRKEKATRMAFFVYGGLMIILPIAVYQALLLESVLADLAYVAWGFGILSVGGILAVYWYEKLSVRYAFLSIGVSWLITAVLFFYVMLPTVDAKNAVTLGMKYLPEEANIVQYQLMNPAFSFYLQRKVPQLNTVQEVDAYLKRYPDSYIISRKNKTADLSPYIHLDTVFMHKDLFERPTTIILKMK